MRQSDALAFLPLIKAWGEGKTLQAKNELGVWTNLPLNFGGHAGHALFCLPLEKYRIKPETIKYRRYLAKPLPGRNNYRILTVHPGDDPKEYEEWGIFIRWIDTEWQELEI